MTQQVLILGGTGRIGRQVAIDLLKHTSVQIKIAGRNATIGHQVCQTLGSRVQFTRLDLADQARLQEAMQETNLVIHCAGPFHHRNASVLKQCIDRGVNYVDVSDHPSFTCKAIALGEKAKAAGITAIANAGVFPGISNSMVRRDVEQLSTVKSIHLSYVVAGSGGAGLTVMRTTFLGLQRSFEVWIDGERQRVNPYSDRENIEFPGFGKVGVYWFDMPESFTLADTFGVKNIVTKFGTVPRFYNYLTLCVARLVHPKLLQTNAAIEFLSRVSYAMTKMSDRISGVGVAIRSEDTGYKYGQPARCISTMTHPNTATAAGIGTGAIAELLLSGQLKKPGVWAPEQALPTDLFESMMQSRGIEIQQHFLPDQRLPISAEKSVV